MSSHAHCMNQMKKWDDHIGQRLVELNSLKFKHLKKILVITFDAASIPFS